MKVKGKGIEYYRRLPYTMFVQPVYEGGRKRYWIAEYSELRGCKTDGPTEHEAIENLRELFEEYIEARLQGSEPIPEPDRILKFVQDIVVFEPIEAQVTTAKEKPEELEVDLSV